MMRKIFVSLAAWLLAAACVGVNGRRTLSTGEWRGVLTRTDGIGVPFNFEVRDTLGKKVVWIENGAGRMRVDSLRYSGDTVFMHMPFFNGHFTALLRRDGSLEGLYTRSGPDSSRSMKFRAYPGVSYRMVARPAPALKNVSGRWAVQFTGATGQPGPRAVGEFHQSGSQVRGTFLTKSGDYRYLEGVMTADTLLLSGFDGSHIFLFRAVAASDTTLTGGEFYWGFDGRSTWQAHRDTAASLPDAFSLTTFNPREDQLDFSFPDIHGEPVSIRDSAFRGKVVIVQIMGSWCPNCMDETAFLSPWYNRNKSRDVAVIGLCYELPEDFHRAVENVLTFKKRFDITYPLLITGVQPGDPDLLKKTLPQLDHFVGFPTTIFVNKKGDIARVHAGFSGPGTGEHYQAFIREFNHLVDSLVAE
jgi:thiol-disulfide isomerase/thioredoxin